MACLMAYAPCIIAIPSQGILKVWSRAFALRVRDVVFYRLARSVINLIYTIGNTRGFKGQRAPFSGGWESEAERQGRRSVMQSQDEGLGYPTEREER